MAIGACRAARAAFAASILSGLCGGEALASPSARLVYSRTADASSCPGEAALRGAVTARFGYDPFFSWAKQTIVVQIMRQHGRYVARLQLLDEQGLAHGTRELTSEQKGCSEIFEASALAIGIALDAASDAVSRADKDSPAEPPATDTPPPPAPTTPAPAPTTRAPTPTPAPAPAPTPALRWAFGVDALASVGTVPAPAPGVSAEVEAGVRPWSLGLELRYDASESASRAVVLGGGRVEASLYVAQIVPCWTLAPLSLCALGAVGVLTARGTDIDPYTSRETLFAAAGARIGVEVPVAAGWAIRVHTDGLVDFHRATLALGPDAPVDVWAAPAFAAAVGFGVAKRFR